MSVKEEQSQFIWQGWLQKRGKESSVFKSSGDYKDRYFVIAKNKLITYYAGPKNVEIGSSYNATTEVQLLNAGFISKGTIDDVENVQLANLSKSEGSNNPKHVLNRMNKKSKVLIDSNARTFHIIGSSHDNSDEVLFSFYSNLTGFNPSSNTEADFASAYGSGIAKDTFSELSPSRKGNANDQSKLDSPNPKEEHFDPSPSLGFRPSALTNAFKKTGGLFTDVVGSNFHKLQVLASGAEEYKKPTIWEHINYNFENLIQSNPSTLLYSLFLVVIIGMLILGTTWYIGATYNNIDDDAYGKGSYLDSLYISSQVVIAGGFEEFTSTWLRLVSA